MPRLYLQARSQIWTMQTHEEIDGGFTMNAFESFIYEILDFAENANNVISETEDEAIDNICKIIDAAETALDKKEFLK